MPFTVRRIHPGEGAAFRSIRLRALADSPFAFASTVEETRARPGEYWQDRVARGAEGTESVLFVAEDGQEWIGVAGGYIYEEVDVKTPYLISMWVDPAYRGRGVGQALVERVIDWARDRGLDHLLLEVEATNHNAISLYTRCGFRPTGEVRPHPTYPDLQEVMMRLSVT